MDCYFTNAEILNHIHGKTDRFGRPRGYVGDLKMQPQAGVEGADHQGQRPGGLDPGRAIARRCGSATDGSGTSR